MLKHGLRRHVEAVSFDTKKPGCNTVGLFIFTLISVRINSYRICVYRTVISKGRP